jgi:carbamoyl-phosphate synthase large subunit
MNRRTFVKKSVGLAGLATTSGLAFNPAQAPSRPSDLEAAGLPHKRIFKVNEGRPNVVGLIKGGDVRLIIYTSAGAHSFSGERVIRRSAVFYDVPCITTMSAAKAAAEAIASRRRDPIRVRSLQEIHEAKAAKA